MRILTYTNPLEIDSNKELWEIVTKFPHFCSSETLKQGLETEYKRETFNYLGTIDNLKDAIFSKYINPISDEINLFMRISTLIRNLDDEKMKSSFRFNIKDVVESVRFLAINQVSSLDFDLSSLSKEQMIILDMYEATSKEEYFKYIKEISSLEKPVLIGYIKSTIKHNVKHILDGLSDFKNIEGLNLSSDSLQDIRNNLILIKKHCLFKRKNSDGFESMSYLDFIEGDANTLIKILDTSIENDFNKVIIHGLHNITAETLFILRTLESKGIEVLFLINYAKNLPNVYNTWKQVYSWVDSKFEFEADLDLNSGNRIGRSIANALEGRTWEKLDESVIVFNNLTSFTDHKVRKIYNRTKKDNSYHLEKMSTQFYAVKGTDSNEILKIYYPEQFDYKPFLSYPIGQFILGIYSMWDFEESKITFNEQSLAECAVSRVFYKEGFNLLGIYTRVKLYFSNVDSYDNYINRIRELRDSNEKIALNSHPKLKMISYFNLAIEEIDIFEQFINFINSISITLFKDSGGKVNFQKHFTQLVDILKSTSSSVFISNSIETELIEDIYTKLNSSQNKSIEGEIKDVKDALFYFLKSNKEKEGSKWIVRDFEQIDGAVLMRKKKPLKTYHYALLSNNHMTQFNYDLVTWPLTMQMFLGCKTAESTLSVVTRSILERKNFLKYTLFYGTFFFHGNIELSYIKEENDEEQSLYYLLKIIGFTEKPFKEEEIVPFQVKKIDYQTQRVNLMRLTYEGKELFSICPYKFFLSEIIGEPIEYSSEYHIKYFVGNYIYEILANQGLLRNNYLSALKKEISFIKKLFPYWNEIVFIDLESEVRDRLEQHFDKDDKITSINHIYTNRKAKFLIAKWSDDNGGNSMNFKRENLNDLMEDYFKSRAMYPSNAYLPHNKVCEHCNYGDVCLRDYYNALADGNDNGN